jgi:hypothetical protein
MFFYAKKQMDESVKNNQAEDAVREVHAEDFILISGGTALRPAMDVL